MNALDELRAASKPRKGPPCKFTQVKLSAEDGKAIKAGLDDQAITNKAIASFLQKRGIDISHWTVARHRRGECACAK